MRRISQKATETAVSADPLSNVYERYFPKKKKPSIRKIKRNKRN